MVRYIFITGGVVSSLGKGLTSAALATLLQIRGYRVCLRKLDPYLNIDPGTMSPYQHGEVFVTDDGTETDLDLGHYERFTGVSATKKDSITTGKIYQTILNKERRGDYLGDTVQVIPHVTDEIKNFILNEGDDEDVDFVLCEIGGTVGDIEGLPFFEAIRQLGNELPINTSIYIHLTLLPYIETVGEIKTKPTQHSVKELRSIGIQPHVLVCRCSMPISEGEKKKISLFCNIREKAVITAQDVDTIYAVPEAYHNENLDKIVLEEFGIQDIHPTPDLSRWNNILSAIREPEGQVNIAIVGKYTGLKDAYKSLIEALQHGGIAHRIKVNIHWIKSDDFSNENALIQLNNINGIIVPGGFGERGSEGKIATAHFARIHKIPYLGICFGMQMAILEIARNMANIKNACSSEFSQEGTPLIIGRNTEWIQGKQLTGRRISDDMGGTMRLGAFDTILKEESRIAKIYQNTHISERHRHRYEVNISYKKQLEKSGLVFSGMSPDNLLPEAIELPNHPWYIGVQFHPELKSRPFAPHPLFSSFIEATCQQNRLI